MSAERMPPLGTLTDRVQVRRRDTVAEAEGGHGAVYVPLATVWARVRALSARSSVFADAQAVAASHSVVMRFRSDIKPKDRLIFRGRTLDVLAAEDMNGRRAYMRCLCAETAVVG
jgi:SPP1 family predicted phage head-tail adaptor